MGIGNNPRDGRVRYASQLLTVIEQQTSRRPAQAGHTRFQGQAHGGACEITADVDAR